MKLTNKFGLPDPVVRALTRSEYSKGDSNRSITQLIDSPRVRILRQEHWDELEEDVSEKMWAVMGTAAHKMFEDTADEKHVSEERLYTEIDGWVISGAIDVQKIEDDGIVVMDYKTTSVWSVILGKSQWEYQLNCYAALVSQGQERPGQGAEGDRHPQGLEIEGRGREARLPPCAHRRGGHPHVDRGAARCLPERTGSPASEGRVRPTDGRGTALLQRR